MAIMKLQNNFTTVEQSKRLLELGLPADSADCRYENNWSHVETHKPVYTKIMHGHPIHNDDMPCWSVGRLIEIFEICTPFVFTGFYNYIGTNTEVMIKIYESVICHPVKNLMDFSKLED